MRPFLSLIRLTVRTTLNRRLIASLVAIGILTLTVLLLFSKMSLDQDVRLVTDFGLAATILITAVVSIIITTTTVLAEQERGTLLLMLPKPVSRTTFLLAKYSGLLLSTLCIYVLLNLIIFGGAAIWYHLPWLDIAITVIAGGFELILLLAIATTAAAFTSPILALMMTIALYLAGHSLSLVLFATNQSSSVVQWIGKGIYYLLPNLEKFNVRELYLQASTLPATYYGWMIVYALVYTAILLTIATRIFNKREW